MRGLFGDVKAFTQENVDVIGKKASTGGVYIVDKDGNPFYVGRSICNVYFRLYKHSRNIGSKAIAAQSFSRLTFEFTTNVMSFEQVEADLAREFGTYAPFVDGEDLSRRTQGNLANIISPADKNPNPRITPLSIRSDPHFGQKR
jgi:predicted GIY-YIG superfamily endonuclease